MIKLYLSRPPMRDKFMRLYIYASDSTIGSMLAQEDNDNTDHAIVEVPQNYVNIKPWRLYFESYRRNNGIGVGILIISPKGIPSKFKFKIQGSCSNSETEFEAIVAGLKILLGLGEKIVEYKYNSELVVKQLTKEYKCIKENLFMYFVTTNSL